MQRTERSFSTLRSSRRALELQQNLELISTPDSKKKSKFVRDAGTRKTVDIENTNYDFRKTREDIEKLLEKAAAKEKKQEEKERAKEEGKKKKKLEKERKKEESNKREDKSSKKSLSSSLELSSDVSVTSSSAVQEKNEPLYELQFKAKNTLSILPVKLLLQIFSYLSPDSLVALTESCKDIKLIVEHSTANLWPSGISNSPKKVCLREYLENLYRESQKDFYLMPNSPEYEVEKCYIMIRILTYLTKLQKKDWYFSKLSTLTELHLSLNNYIEAALTLLMHADEYKWTDLPQSNTKDSLRNSKRLQISFEAGATLSQGNKLLWGWELGISLLQELRKLNINHLKTQSQNLELEHAYFLNIRSKDRFFESYFLVDFVGSDFPPLFKGKSYVFRRSESEKLGNFVSILKARFPTAEIVYNDSDMKDSNANYILI